MPCAQLHKAYYLLLWIMTSRVRPREAPPGILDCMENASMNFLNYGVVFSNRISIWGVTSIRAPISRLNWTSRTLTQVARDSIVRSAEYEKSTTF